MSNAAIRRLRASSNVALAANQYTPIRFGALFLFCTAAKSKRKRQSQGTVSCKNVIIVTAEFSIVWLFLGGLIVSPHHTGVFEAETGRR